MNFETARCPRCREEIAGHELEWKRDGSSAHSDTPTCRGCDDVIEFDDVSRLSREGPFVHYHDPCETILGITPPLDPEEESLTMHYCPSCDVALDIVQA